MNSKICSRCKKSKPLFEFAEIKGKSYSYHKQNTVHGSYDSRCRPCNAEYAREWRKQHKNYRGSGKLASIPIEDRLLVSAIGNRLMQAKQRSKDLNMTSFDLDRDYLVGLFKKQEGRCALSGVLMKVEKKAITCLSLDKIEPDKGYIKGNVQWVAWAANRAKGDMSQDTFLDMCKQIIEYQKVQRLSNDSES